MENDFFIQEIRNSKKVIIHYFLNNLSSKQDKKNIFDIQNRIKFLPFCNKKSYYDSILISIKNMICKYYTNIDKIQIEEKEFFIENKIKIVLNLNNFEEKIMEKKIDIF